MAPLCRAALSSGIQGPLTAFAIDVDRLASATADPAGINPLGPAALAPGVQGSSGGAALTGHRHNPRLAAANGARGALARRWHVAELPSPASRTAAASVCAQTIPRATLVWPADPACSNVAFLLLPWFLSVVALLRVHRHAAGGDTSDLSRRVPGAAELRALLPRPRHPEEPGALLSIAWPGHGQQHRGIAPCGGQAIARIHAVHPAGLVAKAAVCAAVAPP
mmetsp:Transcript_39519/g.112065  ORF Transcript_39519/g.112065 Transcript_39519/m.112065 type:complete len:222 (-) Transcript_39519:1082-1747(-)